MYLKNAALALLCALIVAFHIPTPEPDAPTMPDYCSITYASPWDGTPQAPIGCESQP